MEDTRALRRAEPEESRLAGAPTQTEIKAARHRFHQIMRAVEVAMHLQAAQVARVVQQVFSQGLQALRRAAGAEAAGVQMEAEKR